MLSLRGIGYIVLNIHTDIDLVIIKECVSSVLVFLFAIAAAPLRWS